MTFIKLITLRLTSARYKSKVNSIPVRGWLSKLAVLCLVGLPGAATAAAQTVEVRIAVDESRPAVAKVEGRFSADDRVSNLSFLTAYAGVDQLADRISDVRVADAEKKPVDIRKLQSGEYLAEGRFSFFAYNVDLRPLANASAAAHVSWLADDHGILAMDDLLPQPLNKVRVQLKLELPRSWRTITNEDRSYEDTFNLHDAQSAIILVGRSWRMLPIGNAGAKLAITGEWQFSDDNAVAEALEILRAYRQIFGAAPSGADPLIVITNFPVKVSPGNWEAETRGSIVTITSSGGLSSTDSRQRLRQQLRHEIFHLWLPNAVNLTGNYDWFYEGFATYEEQKLGVALNHIRFNDFLATLGRAFDVARFSGQGRSLVEASRERWAGASRQVYARGLIVAFLADVALLDVSKGKRSVETLLKKAFEKHRPPAVPTPANEAIIAMMRQEPELIPVVERYIAGKEGFDWAKYVERAGLKAVESNQLTELAVVDKPTGRQKDLLDKLGYNSWRKLASK